MATAVVYAVVGSQVLAVSTQYFVAEHPTPTPSSQVKVTLTLLAVHVSKV